jgi:hypothetical protein
MNQIAKINSKHQDVQYRDKINFDLGTVITLGELISKATTFSLNQSRIKVLKSKLKQNNFSHNFELPLGNLFLKYHLDVASMGGYRVYYYNLLVGSTTRCLITFFLSIMLSNKN